LEIGQTRPSLYRIFFDILPDKLKEVKAKTSVVHGLARRRCILDGVYLFDCTKKHPGWFFSWKLLVAFFDWNLLVTFF
jgi:hypothetical protein